MGPGDNIGLCASKSSATAIRGQYYGIGAAMGKIGAFVGTYVFPIIQNNAPNEIRKGQDPFFVASSLCIFSAALAYFLLPQIGQVRGDHWYYSSSQTANRPAGHDHRRRYKVPCVPGC